MRRLILSDIHANLEALEAVLADACNQYDEIVCCGDLVGYGASPAEVVAWARRNAAVIVRGNHDRACAGIEAMEDFNNAARDAALWTRHQLPYSDLAWLAALPAGPLRYELFEVAHGSPIDEDEYLVSDFEAYSVSRYIERPVSFIGHTHLQGLWSFRAGEFRKAPPVKPGQHEHSYTLDPASVYLVNPGAVGQPRDGDPRAGYALWDDASGTLLLRRVAYDIAGAQARIRQAGLPEHLASRLAHGR